VLSAAAAAGMAAQESEFAHKSDVLQEGSGGSVFAKQRSEASRGSIPNGAQET